MAIFCRVPVDRVATTARRWVTMPTPSQEGGYSTSKLTGWHLSAYTRHGNQIHHLTSNWSYEITSDVFESVRRKPVCIIHVMPLNIISWQMLTTQGRC